MSGDLDRMIEAICAHRSFQGGDKNRPLSDEEGLFVYATGGETCQLITVK